MNPLVAFYRRGAEDADRRVAAVLAPVEIAAADRYLQTSRAVTAIDRLTRRLREWWLASAAGRAVSLAQNGVAAAPPGERYQAVAVLLLTAAIAHVALMWLQQPRPGWFWMVIPGMAALFATLVFAGSHSSRSAD